MTIKYTEDHEWVREQDGVYTVGITHHAQEQLGEIVFVELPEANDSVTRGEEAAVVESVKAAGEVKSPLSGTVIKVNDKLAEQPELVNSDPEGEGWFYQIKADDAQPMEQLMDTEAYQKFVQSLD